MAENQDNTSPCWRSFAQSLAWICQGRPNAPEEWAWKELQLELVKDWADASEGVPIAKFRYPLAGKMFDLVVLIKNKRLTFEDVRWPNVECNLEWLKRRWPAPAHEAEPNFEVGPRAPASSEAFQSLPPPPPTEPALSPSEPSATQESPAEDAKWPRLLRLPEEPQFEARNKWRPEEANAWLVEKMANDPPKPGENKSEWARRQYPEMEKDFGENIPWTEGTLRRRMDD